MPVVPDATIAEPLEGFRKMLREMKQWQAWAGDGLEDQIYLNENRSHTEMSGGNQAWFNDELTMPFAIIWMPELEINPITCLYHYSVAMLFQGKAEDRQTHNESFYSFANPVGKIIDEIADHIREGKLQVPNVQMIKMVGEPTRVSVESSELRNDFWTSTFLFEVNE